VSSAEAWDNYLSTLEQAALSVESEVSQGRSPGWLGLQPPPPPVPTHLRVRCEMLLMLLNEVTQRTERRRTDLREQLAAMPHRRPVDHARAASLGHQVDVVG
jgi:hypothetical protein